MPSDFLQLLFGFLLGCLASHLLPFPLSFQEGYQGNLAGRGNFSVFRHVSTSRLRNGYCLKYSEDPCRKNDISGFVCNKLFIQKVTYSFLDGRIVYQSFYCAPLTFSYFFIKEKFSVSRTSRGEREITVSPVRNEQRCAAPQNGCKITVQ